MAKNTMKNNKKRRRVSPHVFVAVVALLFTLSVLSRALPDGTARLNVGDSGIGEKAIALTFDDGPAGHTEKLLDGLAEYNAKATFFVVGENAEKYPLVVGRAYDEGHLIGNHTYDHPRLTLLTPAAAKENNNLRLLSFGLCICKALFLWLYLSIIIVVLY